MKYTLQYKDMKRLTIKHEKAIQTLVSRIVGYVHVLCNCHMFYKTQRESTEKKELCNDKGHFIMQRGQLIKST